MALCFLQQALLGWWSSYFTSREFHCLELFCFWFLAYQNAMQISCECPKSLQKRRGSAVACGRVRGTEWGSSCSGSFQGGHHHLHYLHHSLAPDQETGCVPSPAHQQKIGLKIYRAWLHPSEQDPVSLSQFLPSGGFHKPLILLHHRANRMKNTITEN